MSHEPVNSFRRVKTASDRKFGLVVGGLLAVIALWPTVWRGEPTRWWLLAVGAALLILGVLRPTSLRPLNRLWSRLGLLLHRVTNPIVMGLLFFGAVVPMGWLLRKRAVDLLRLRMDPDAKSYWITRTLAGPDPTSFKKQF